MLVALTAGVNVDTGAIVFGRSCVRCSDASCLRCGDASCCSLMPRPSLVSPVVCRFHAGEFACAGDEPVWYRFRLCGCARGDKIPESFLLLSYT